MLRSFTFAYLLFFASSAAAAQDTDAREIAHCGYLAFIAAEQMHQRGDAPERLDAIVSDVVDFSAIFAALTGQGRKGEVEFTADLLVDMTRLGQSIHAGRIRSMNAANALTLSNRLLDDCRQDLALFSVKMKP